MSAAVFLFHAELNDFLYRARRGMPITVSFKKSDQTAKHLIESLGVPHIEIGAVTANGKAVETSYRVQDGDRLEVRPAAPGCPCEPRFLLDNHLGRLAAHLRMLGFDCLYRNDYEDAQLAEILTVETRILLTRDRQMLMRKVVQYGYCLRSLEPGEQLREVVHHFDLGPAIHPFQRCLRCNGRLEPVGKEAVLDRLQPLTKKYFNEFHLCHTCDQVYWKGSHYERMLELISSLKQWISIPCKSSTKTGTTKS